MRLELSFKGSAEGYVSCIHRGIRWTCVIISQGQKLTTTDAPLLLSLWERVIQNYVFPRALREREGSNLLEFSLGLPVSLQFLSFSSVPLQASRALNVCLNYHHSSQVTITFQRVLALEVGEAYQERPYESVPS